MGTRGVWSLDNVEIKYPQNDWVPLPSVWAVAQVTKPNAGWVGGGNYKKLAKISFDTDSKTQYGYNWEWSSPTTFNGAGNRAAGTAAATHGYFSGGSNSPGWPSTGYTSYMTKLVYATGVPLTSPSNTISANRSFHVGVSADEHGYLLGGSTYPSSLPYDSTSDTKLSIVDKITNSTDTAARVPAADLPSAQTKKAMSASAANPSFAYMSGGITPIVSTAARFTYSTETVTQTPSANNLTARSYHSASSNGSTNFYWHGGGTTNKTIANASPALNYMTKSTEKTVIATDTTSAIPAQGDTVYCSRGNTGNSLAAYSFGGGTPYGITYQSDKMTYSNETKAATPSLNLQASYGWSDISPVKGLSTLCPTGEIVRFVDQESETPNFGIFTGQPGGGSWVDKLDYSTETMENIGNISPSSYASGITRASGGSSKTDGYFLSSSQGGSCVWKTSYSTETTSRNPTRHAVTGQGHGVPMDTSTATYVTNLYQASPAVRACWKITHADDSTSQVPALTKSWNSEEVFGSMSVSSIDEGTAYITAGGSAIPSTYRRTYTEKITFATDTRVRLPASNYPNNSIYGCSVGGPSAGYFSEGYSDSGYTSQLYKLNYSDETFSDLGNLEGTGGSSGSENERKGNLGSTLSGYFFSGLIDGNNQGSNVDKFVYASDTISNLPGVLITANPGSATQWARDIGYGSASARQNNRSVADRPEATPTSSTTNLGIPENGYIAGGYGNVSSISKLDMASETYTRLDTALYEANRRLSGFGNLTQGYATGGTQPVRTTCQKFVYSTDTRTTLTSNLTAARGYLKAIGNNTAGYVGGGTPQGSYGTKLDKMPYSNETFSSLPNIPGSRYRYASLGNQTQGYFAGGYPSQQSKVKKITYSSDSYANAPNLTYSATFQTGTGNATKGYFVSGEGGGTKVDRITFSNDTISRVPSADLSATRYALEANNSPSKAYFTGGSPGVKTNTEVITFSNDTTALSTTANADTGDNQAGAFAAFGPNWCGNPGSDIHPNII